VVSEPSTRSIVPTGTPLHIAISTKTYLAPKQPVLTRPRGNTPWSRSLPGLKGRPPTASATPGRNALVTGPDDGYHAALSPTSIHPTI
jgi:hypothetical protein